MNKVCIPGGLGGIGGVIVHQLVQDSTIEKIIILDNASKEVYHSQEILESFKNSKVKIVNIDLTNSVNKEAIIPLIQECDTVLMLSSRVGGIGYFNHYSYEILRDNNIMLEYVINALTPEHRFVYISSSMVFECTNEYPSTEESLSRVPIPQSAYGFSKLCGEYYTREGAKNKGYKYNIVRPFNSLTGSEYPKKDMVGYSHVFSDIVRKIWEGQGTKENPLEILGDSNQIRCYTSCEDIANGIITVAKSDRLNEDYNVATDEQTSVKELATKIWRIMKYHTVRPQSFPKFKSLPGLPHDVQKRVPSTAKIKEHLGWEAKYKLDDKLPEVVYSVVKILESQKQMAV